MGPIKSSDHRRPARFALGAGLVMLAALAARSAWAADAAHGSEAVFLLQILALLVCGRLLGEVMSRIGQPAVMGQLLGGILLGPSVLGALLPDVQHALFPVAPEQKAMIDAVAQLGVLMLLLLTGMETDLSVVRHSRRTALSVSLAGIALPFACGLAVGLLMPEDLLPDPQKRFITALFLATALSISSVKIVAMVVREVGFLRRTVGQVIVASAIIDDTIGWIIMAVTFGLALHGAVDLVGVARAVLGTALFLGFSFTIGRRLVFRAILWANDRFVSEMPVITTILVIMGVMALITQAIGVHTVLGAFVAGILVGQSPNLTRHIDAQLRGLIVALFMPVFFGMAGLTTDLAALAKPELLLLTIGLIAIASLGKFSGAMLGGHLGGLTWKESFAAGCGMNARGSTEVIVASLGLAMGALDPQLFTAIVAMAVVTTLSMPPMLRWALGRLTPSAEEQARLEREKVESSGYVPQLERLLVAVDASPSGALASRLVGLLAGARRITTTVLHFDYTPEVALPGGSTQAERTRTLVESSAEAGAAGDSREAGEQPAITTRAEAPSETTIAAEGRKGYDLVVIGREPASEGDGFHRQIADSAAAFPGGFAIAIARGRQRAHDAGPPRNILVPVDGTPAARHAAELAIALVQGTGGSVTAVHMLGRSSRPRGPRDDAASLARDTGVAILDEVGRLGEPYGVTVNGIMRETEPSEAALLREIASRRHDLLVMGVNPRPGAHLFFGPRAARLLEAVPCSLLFVAETPFARDADKPA